MPESRARLRRIDTRSRKKPHASTDPRSRFDDAPMSEQRIESGEEYIHSLRGRGLRVFYKGERIDEPVDHPVIQPSIAAVAMTFSSVSVVLNALRLQRVEL